MGGGVKSWPGGGKGEAAAEGASEDDEDEGLGWGRRDWEGSVPVMPPVLMTLGGSPWKWLPAGLPFLLPLL